MAACVLDEASENELRHLAVILANREAQKPTFESYHDCQDCGEPIPEKRRQFAKGITRCVDCQSIVDLKNKGVIRR